jgi:endoglucanase
MILQRMVKELVKVKYKGKPLRVLQSIGFTVLFILLASCGSQSTLEAEATVRYGFPQHVTYAANTIRPNHLSQSVQDQDVKTFYDLWKKAYVVKTTQKKNTLFLYRIAFGKPGTANWSTTVSEGQGYGMMIVALMAGYDASAKTVFDGLWLFSRAYPSSIDNRLMGWKIPSDDPNYNDSAFDGDADIAYALLLADKQWGSTGVINYLQEAKTVIKGIKESTIGVSSKLPCLGDWARDLDNATTPYDEFSPRPSDFMPSHFRAYGKATNDVAFWNQVIAAMQNVTKVIQTSYSPKTGLLPDFITSTCNTTSFCPAPPNFLEDVTDGDYAYNAGRVPMRLGIDALFGNTVSRSQVSKLSVWMKAKTNGNPAMIKAGYKLDGTPIAGGDYFTTFFVAPFGVAAMNVQSQQSWLNSLYDSVRKTHEDYYQDSVTLLSLLIMTGNYWDVAKVQ